MKKYTVIDLFCGCGGFSQGFKQAEFDVLLGLDSWKEATTTYAHNFTNTIVLNKDITLVNGDSIREALDALKDSNNSGIDVIIGGPPCQGFSLSGKRMLDDPRNALYKSFVKIVEEINPRYFVMENVLGLIRLFDGKVKNEVIEDFTKIGYNVEMQVLSAEQYGVPQQRKRVFFVGVNKETVKNTHKFIFPEITHGNSDELLDILTCKDAISDLDFLPDDVRRPNNVKYELEPINDYQMVMRVGSKGLLNHSITIHKERTKEIIALVPDGGNYKSLPEELRDTRKVNIAWTRMNSNKACFTIDTGHNHHFHYKENRVPTVRESARIQSFPDTFEFLGIKTSQLKQVGNAVPPLLAKAIADKIKSDLDKENGNVQP